MLGCRRTPLLSGSGLRTVEVRREPGGWVELELSAQAAQRASEAGLERFAVSLTHEGEYASAVVVGESTR